MEKNISKSCQEITSFNYLALTELWFSVVLTPEVVVAACKFWNKKAPKIGMTAC